MKRVLRSIAVFICFLNCPQPFQLLSVSQVSGSSNSATESAGSPVPAQIAAAHTVFLSNLGADASFPIGFDQIYADITKALGRWGRYRLVSSPGDADLIFELRGVSSLTTVSGADDSVYTMNNPVFQLGIVDRVSQVTLWTINSPVALAGSRQTRAHWIAISETNLISRIKVVAGESLAPVETADLTTVPNPHHVRTALLIIGGTAAVAAGGGLLLHHLYENGLSDQKSAQDAFCTANHIPLSQCAGG